MDILSLVAAFGGGLFGACIGGLPAFILAGVIAIAGGVTTLAGAPDLAVGNIAFGSLLGPHISFGAAVVAAAFAANKRHNLDSGTDILYSLNGTGDYLVLIVGGIFGVIAFLLNYLYAVILVIPTDTIALTVFTMHVMARFLFGSTGLTGEFKEKGKRKYFTSGQGMIYNIILGGGIGMAVGYVAGSMKAAGVNTAFLSIYPVICFGISAVSLIFTQTGFATPATHHITLPAASAAVMSGNPFMGVVFGIVGSLIGDAASKTLNSYCDTHIDPPATAIFTTMFIVNALF
jgi:hypothetical protein